ncbi:T9SS type A sorting domain-containing protein [Bacteroidota bacterium]
MKKLYFLVIGILCLSLVAPFFSSTLSIPDAQNIYGGRINAITGYQYHTDTTRVFVATQSANSVFYADMYTTNSGTPAVTPFKVMPSLDDTKNFGSQINKLAAHQSSGTLYFIKNGSLYHTNPSLTTNTDVGLSNVNNIFIEGDYAFSAQATDLNFGTLDASNVYTSHVDSPISLPSLAQQASYVVHPVSGHVFIFTEGTSPQLFISTDVYTAFNSTTTFTDISPTLVSATVSWKAFGIGPDGRYFIGGTNNTNKYIAYSDDNGTTWTEYDMGIGGVAGPNFDFAGTSSSYHVYFASVYSSNNGLSGSWHSFGNVSGYAHPNDGVVYQDPNNVNMVYMTSDQGLGVSYSKGLNMYSADSGIEAVQVNDMEMTSDKDTAWIASKSGIRKVVDYQSTPVWTNAIFPQNDGSTYYSVGMNPTNSNIAYAGNLRIYKTSNGGSSWSKIFTPENAPYNYPSVGTIATSITVCEYNEDIIMAGFELSGTSKGGLFYSHDAGVTWDQLLLHASSGNNDVDVRDVIFNVEGTDTIAYVGVDYDLSAPTGRSVYKITKSGAVWTPAQDMTALTTSTGSLIVASITDLDKDTSTNEIFAAGTDAGSNHPIVYYKPLSGTGLWTPYTTSGFPFVAGKEGKAITKGIDTVYCAVDNEVYYLPNGGSSWVNGYTYPLGTDINFLFYDDLLVATNTGLYAQSGPTTAAANIDAIRSENYFEIFPNPVVQGNDLTVKLNISAQESYSIQIANLNGQVLLEEYNTGTDNSIQIPKQLIPGTYLVRLLLNGKNASTRKLIIN